MRRSLLALAVLPGCALYLGEGDAPAPAGGGGELAGRFTLTKTRAIAGELPVVGIDGDGDGGLWIAYRLASDYYTPADVRVVHVDAGGAKLGEWRYGDEYTQVSGIAYSGDAVWLSYAGLTIGNHHVRKLDPTTGARIASFATEGAIVDLDARDGELLLSSMHDEVIALDLETGAERTRFPVPAIESSTQRGIATTADGKLWISSTLSSEVLLLDAQHEPIGSGAAAVLDRDFNLHDKLHLAWDGTQLIVAVRNQIVWLAPP